MKRKLIISILLLTLLWPAHFTYAVENGCLRPVAAWEKEENAIELELSCIYMIHVNPSLAIARVATKIEKEWGVAISITDKVTRKERDAKNHLMIYALLIYEGDWMKITARTVKNVHNAKDNKKLRLRALNIMYALLNDHDALSRNTPHEYLLGITGISKDEATLTQI